MKAWFVSIGTTSQSLEYDNVNVDTGGISMPLESGLQNIIETITLSNLGNLTAPIPTLVIPAGLTDLYLTTIRNGVNENLGLAPDIQQLVKSLVINNQVVIITI